MSRPAGTMAPESRPSTRSRSHVPGARRLHRLRLRLHDPQPTRPLSPRQRIRSPDGTTNEAPGASSRRLVPLRCTASDPPSGVEQGLDQRPVCSVGPRWILDLAPGDAIEGAAGPAGRSGGTTFPAGPCGGRFVVFRSGGGIEVSTPRAAVSHVVPPRDSPDRGDFDRQRARGSPRPCRPQGHWTPTTLRRPACPILAADPIPSFGGSTRASQLSKTAERPDLQCLDNWGALRLAMGCRRWEVVLRPSVTLAPEAHARAQQSRGSSSLAVVTHDRATPQNRAGGSLLIITFSCRSVCLSRRRRVGAPYRKRG